MTRSDSARRRSERSHSRNEVTKKKKSSTTTPQNGFSSWRRSPVKNQRAISRFKNSLHPRYPLNFRKTQGRGVAATRTVGVWIGWMGNGGTGLRACVVQSRRTVRHKGVRSAYGSVLLRAMQCAPPRSPSRISQREKSLEKCDVYLDDR